MRTGVEGALIGSLVSHEHVKVIPVVLLLVDAERQDLLVKEEATQTLLPCLSLLLELTLPQGLLLELSLL